jgi:NADPH:quinone reductase-like Zn-dependent oxidoreductase
VLLVAYSLIPTKSSGEGSDVPWLILELCVFGAVVGIQLPAIIKSKHPVLRAAEALAILVPLYLLIFFGTRDRQHIGDDEGTVSAGVKPGTTVAAVGDGAVGLCGVLAASELGAEQVIAMSRHQPRQQLAKEFGATDIVPERGDEGIARVKELTEGVGADLDPQIVASGLRA